LCAIRSLPAQPYDVISDDIAEEKPFFRLARRLLVFSSGKRWRAGFHNQRDTACGLCWSLSVSPTHCVQGPHPACQRTTSYLRSDRLTGRRLRRQVRCRDWKIPLHSC